jgi:hypothetical protein
VCSAQSRYTRLGWGFAARAHFPRLTDTQFCGRIVETLQVVICFRRGKFRASSSSLKVDRLLKRDLVAFGKRPFAAVRRLVEKMMQTLGTPNLPATSLPPSPKRPKILKCESCRNRKVKASGRSSASFCVNNSLSSSLIHTLFQSNSAAVQAVRQKHVNPGEMLCVPKAGASVWPQGSLPAQANDRGSQP